MRLEPIAALAVLLAMSACGSNGRKDEAASSQGNAAAPAVTATATASLSLNPGEWQMTIDSSGMNVPGMPAEVAKMMKGTKVVTSHCITPEEARRPTGETFGGRNKGDCKQSEFSLSGGKLHAVTTCSGAGGKGGTTIASDGEFSGDAFDVRSKMTTDTGKGEMTMESHIAARRIGECAAKAAG